MVSRWHCHHRKNCYILYKGIPWLFPMNIIYCTDRTSQTMVSVFKLSSGLEVISTIDYPLNAWLCCRCGTPAELAGVRLVHWLNHAEAALCGSTKQDAMLVSKSRSLEPPDRLIQLSSSPLMLGVLLLLAVLAAMMVILALALQRRNVRMRKLRRNRRFWDFQTNPPVSTLQYYDQNLLNISIFLLYQNCNDGVSVRQRYTEKDHRIYISYSTERFPSTV